MQLVFFNLNTQSQYPYEIDDNILSDIENTRILCNGQVYRMISTVPDEVNRINKLRQEFEGKEFTKLMNEKFNYADKKDVPANFKDMFNEEVDRIISENYKEFYEIIKDNKEAVYNTISMHFLTFVFMTHRFNDMQEQNVKAMRSPSYAKDFAERFKHLFTSSVWYNTKSMYEMSEQIEQLRKFMDIDERRHAGKDRVLGGIGKIATDLSAVLASADINDIKTMKISKENEKYGKLFNDVTTIFKGVHKYYDDLIKEIDNTVKKIAEINEDKLIGYLTVAKPIIVKFLKATDKYMKDASAVQTVDENDKAEVENNKARLDLIKKTYIEELQEYYTNLEGLMTAYDTDTRTADAEKEKQFTALWEASMYYKSQTNSGDWFIQLARLIYNSFNALFEPVLTEDEKIKQAGDAPADAH